ncbi:24265_t:CDS:1 [Gigaspora margarita]|uniref:24265_t:CDS:1 n=1 Tax=Gigaspora margarita TaxID=4874 RepID=A0ABN7VQN6_GIGMA|nr:24265_t:CDS:1 [Gigaspora margarita]
MLKKEIINLLVRNKFHVTNVKKNPYPILKVLFREYYYYLIIWDKDTISEKNLLNLKKEMTCFYKVEHVNINVISILVYKSSLTINIDTINKNIPKMNTQSIKDIINFLKDNIYNKYATKYIEVPQRREDFIQFMKTNVEDVGDIVKYFKKWLSDMRQYNKAFEFFALKNPKIEEISKIANNTKSAFNKDACYFLYKYYYYSKPADEEATYKYFKLYLELYKQKRIKLT